MLKEFAHKLAKHLSGGMKRKLSLAIAIVSKPQILILDEPTSGLDEQSRTQVIKLIMKMKMDRAILAATQHLDEAEQFSDQILVMHQGELKENDTPQNIMKNNGVGYKIIIDLSKKVDDRLSFTT